MTYSVFDAINAAVKSGSNAIESILAPPQQLYPGPSTPTLSQSLSGISTIDIDCTTLSLMNPLTISATGDTLIVDPISNGWCAVWLDTPKGGAPFLLRPGMKIRAPFTQLSFIGSPNQSVSPNSFGAVAAQNFYPQIYPRASDPLNIFSSNTWNRFVRLRFGNGIDIDSPPSVEWRRPHLWFESNFTATLGGTTYSSVLPIGDGGVIRRLTVYVRPTTFGAVEGAGIGCGMQMLESDGATETGYVQLIGSARTDVNQEAAGGPTIASYPYVVFSLPDEFVLPLGSSNILIIANLYSTNTYQWNYDIEGLL